MMWRTYRTSRRGVLLAETAAATLLLAIAMAMIIRLVGWMALERRNAERRGWAIQQAANAMETLAAMPFDRLSTESARSATALSPSARQVLARGEIEASVTDDPPMKRIDVSVRWTGKSGNFDAPVRLSAWISRKGDTP
jgi:hypothetical protein